MLIGPRNDCSTQMRTKTSWQGTKRTKLTSPSLRIAHLISNTIQARRICHTNETYRCQWTKTFKITERRPTLRILVRFPSTTPTTVGRILTFTPHFKTTQWTNIPSPLLVITTMDCLTFKPPRSLRSLLELSRASQQTPTSAWYDRLTRTESLSF